MRSVVPNTAPHLQKHVIAVPAADDVFSFSCFLKKEKAPNCRSVPCRITYEVLHYVELKDVPAWYKPTVEKLVKKGAFNGTGDGVLNVFEDFCRTMTVLDRLGKLD